MYLVIIHKEIYNLLAIFSSRELAYIAWTAILICCFIVIPSLRTSFCRLLKVFFNWKFNVIYILTVGYFLFVIYILRNYGVWDKSLLKDTIYWIVLNSTILMFEIGRNKEPINFLRNTIKDSVKITVFLSFVMNLATFNVWLEFIAVPILIFLIGIHTVSQHKKEYVPVRKVLDTLGLIASVILLIYILYFAIENYNKYLNTQTLKEFVLPIILTFLFIPFLALLNLYVQYEEMAISLKRKSKNKSQYYQMLVGSLFFFNFNIKGAIRWRNSFVYLEPNESLWDSMKRIRTQQIKEDVPPKYPELEGWNPADAKQFLIRQNIIIKEYHSNLGEIWEGKSQDLKLDEDFMSGICNYSIEGNKYIIRSLKLHFTCYERSRINDLNKFLAILNELYYMVEYEATPPKIKEHILKFENLEYNTPYTTISIYFFKWENEKKGYDLYTTIKHRNLIPK